MMMKLFKRWDFKILCLLLFVVFMMWLYGRSSLRNRHHKTGKSKLPILMKDHFRTPINKVGKVSKSKQEAILADQFAVSFVKNGKAFCDSNFIAYGHFAKVTNIILNPSFGELKQDKNTKINAYVINKGFFQMECNGTIDVEFKDGLNHLNLWANAIKTGPLADRKYELITDWTIAITRNHNGSLYYTMLDIYNAFLLSRAFDIDPRSVNILFIDGNQKNIMDSAWAKIFRKVFIIAEITRPVLYKNMIWGMTNNDSPLNFEQKFKSIPNLEEFRKFVLKRHYVDLQHKPDCQNLNVLILNKREKFGELKNKNRPALPLYEFMLYPGIYEFFSDHKMMLHRRLNGTLKEQLDVITKVDVFVTLHREELTHVIFLPKTAIVLEIFQLNVLPSANKHYQALAQWRNLTYQSWGGAELNLKMSPKDYILVELLHKAGEMFRQKCMPYFR